MTESKVQDLRAWAAGDYGREAAMELMARFSDGRFLAGQWPWIIEGEPFGHFVDAQEITEATVGRFGSACESVLLLAAALIDGRQVSILSTIRGLDAENLDLVLAALRHANGNHEHTSVVEHWPSAGE